MDEARMRGAMGLCVRAKQAVFGTDGCISEARSGNCGLVLMSDSTSVGTKEKIHSACKSGGVPLLEIPDGLIDVATGHSGVVMAVKPGGFCEKLMAIASGQIADTGKKSSNKNKDANKFGGVNV